MAVIVMCVEGALSPQRGVHKHRSTCDSQGNTTVIMSAYNGPSPRGDPPVGFNWMNILSANFSQPEQKRNYVLLLHGATLLYGLKPQIVPNPYEGLLTTLASRGVSIRICHLCLSAAGYAVIDLLSFVQPVAFSIDYLISEQQNNGSIVIFDSPIPSTSPIPF